MHIKTLLGLAALVWLSSTPAVAQTVKNKAAPVTAQVVEEKLASISADPAKLADAINKGKKSAAFCRHCHGDGGYSVTGDTPNLAAQKAAYMAEQMNKLADGRRKSEFMEGLIKALTLEERVNIALFYANQPPPDTSVKNIKQAAQGKQLYDKICINCHAANGAGTNKIPRIAGQQIQYLGGSLKRYRGGSGVRIDLQMAAFTRNLKDAEIVNLAAYISSIP